MTINNLKNLFALLDFKGTVTSSKFGTKMLLEASVLSPNNKIYQWSFWDFRDSRELVDQLLKWMVEIDNKN